MIGNLGLIVLKNCEDFGKKVNEGINKLRSTNEDYIVKISNCRFSNGEGKIVIDDTVRNKDLYIISDIENYSITYKLHNFENHMSPDEHYQDIKRVISATSGHASRINVVMPMLYQARQHKRKGRESLDCAIALQELESLGVSNIITFDTHDPSIVNSIPTLPFENLYPTNSILHTFIQNEKKSLNNLIVISPDFGATQRAKLYAEMLNCDVGVFYKRRDLNKVVDGKNPIVEHAYMGSDVKDKNIIVVDDMIASGGSMLDVAAELKKRGANKIFFIATFSLFTSGTADFEKAYKDGLFTKLYSTNLSYIPDEIKNSPWFYEVDCSNQLAEIIDALNKGNSISSLINNKKSFLDEINKHK